MVIFVKLCGLKCVPYCVASCTELKIVLLLDSNDKGLCIAMFRSNIYVLVGTTSILMGYVLSN